MTTKKVLCAIPPAMLEKIDFIAKYEYRTRADLIREALRRYENEWALNSRLDSVRNKIAAEGVGT